MQFMLIIAAAVAAMLFDLRGGQAFQGPWCAGTNRGSGAFVYDCSMRTLEQCVSEVIAGNRGFCNPNPYYRPGRSGNDIIIDLSTHPGGCSRPLGPSGHPRA
jgi:hypothetical protein